jgi:nicotinamidase/pyrazinamidase
MKKFMRGDILFITDPQKDFMPGGALAVPEGDSIIPVANAWIKAAQQQNIPIVISRDWHPSNHISFLAQGGEWPPHCIQNTPGAAFHEDLVIPNTAIIVNKAFLPDKEAYSALDGVIDTTHQPLVEKLKQLAIQRVWIGGLALDYCVFYTAVDIRNMGLKCHIILPACRAIAENTKDQAMAKLKELQAVFEN